MISVVQRRSGCGACCEQTCGDQTRPRLADGAPRSEIDSTGRREVARVDCQVLAGIQAERPRSAQHVCVDQNVAPGSGRSQIYVSGRSSLDGPRDSHPPRVGHQNISACLTDPRDIQCTTV